MYVLRVGQFLLLFLVVHGSYYTERSSSNGFSTIMNYLSRSNVGNEFPSRHNAQENFQSRHDTRPNLQNGYVTRPNFHNSFDTPPNFNSGYDTRPNVHNMYDTGSHFQSGYDTGPQVKGGHDTGRHSQTGNIPDLKTMDVTRLCDTVTCIEGTCSVIIEDIYSYPVTICETDGDPTVPRNAHAACRKNGFTTAVLTGDPHAMRPLRPVTCLSCEDCPYGTTCISNTCCYGTPNCTDTLKTLFQKSFEFNGHTYILSRNLIENDMQSLAICVALGGYLVEIETREENNAIKNFLEDCGITDSVLISGTDADEEGVFVHQYSGETLGFFDWDTGARQPRGGRSENCIVIDTYQWHDRDCFDNDDFLILCEFAEALKPDFDFKKGYH